MKDITSRQDIEALMNAFYSKAIPDEIIGHFFEEVMHMDLQTHLPVITDFWESILLNNPALYTRNAMEPHLNMHQKSAMTKAHFDRWLKLFNETLESMFSGDVAELAKQRALSIATVMQIKIHQLNAK